MDTLLIAAGLGQLGLALASLFLPRILRWRETLAALPPLTRRIFWVYAGYILATNVCLGSLSALAPHLLLARTALARLVAAYAGAYWGARLLIQFVWFRGAAPKGAFYLVVDWAVTALFALCAAVYLVLAFDRW